MHVDEKTVRDLELFRTRDGGPGVFAVLDRTRTLGGSRALRARIGAPMSSLADIRRVQDGVGFLVREGVRFEPDGRLMEGVARYLESSWDSVSSPRGLRCLAESVVIALRYRDLLRYARQGVESTRRLLDGLRPYLDSVARPGSPPAVEDPVRELQALIDRVRTGRLRTSGGPWTVLRADHVVRVQRKADLGRILELLYELDALCAMARLLDEDGWTLPELVDGGGFELDGTGVVHPFLERPVPNPVKVSGGESLVFLTGPNMAGKTTWLKAVTLSAYLAHVGMPVPARRFRMSVLDAVYTSLSPEENLRAGLSYFMAEVRRVREVAEAVARGVRALVVFDEVFRGTNVRDALDASRLVTLGFARSRTSGFIVSSHLVELAEDLREEERIRFACFDGTIRDGRARYGFRIREGVSDQRFGLHLLEQERVPALLRSLEGLSGPPPP